MFRVLIAEKDQLVAKGLRHFVHKIFGNSDKVKVEYFVDSDSAVRFSMHYTIDLFIVGISSEATDIGTCFMRYLSQVEEYLMPFTILLAPTVDDEIRKVILEEFDCFKLLTMPINEEVFTQTVMTVSGYKMSRTQQDYISLVRDCIEREISLAKILWASVENREVTVNMCNNKVETFAHSDYSLKNLKVILGTGFIHIYRSVIVNKSYVAEIDYSKKQLKLAGVEKTFKIGGTYLADVKMCFGDGKNKGGEQG